MTYNPGNGVPEEIAAMSGALSDAVAANRPAALRAARKVQSVSQRQLNCPVITRGKPIVLLEDNPIDVVHELLLAGCNAVIVVGGFTEAQLRERLGDDADRVTIIAQAADPVMRIVDVLHAGSR